MRKLTLAIFLTAAPTVAIAQPQEIFWDNNGSLMRTVDDGYRISVSYETVRPSLWATIAPGSLAFEGARVNGNGIVGNAFVYTKYCYGTPFPYRVTGAINGVIDVWGPAAVVDPNICRIIGLEPNSDNAHRIFQVPPPPAPPSPRELSPDEQAEVLRRQGQEFCWKYPAHRVCNDEPPPPVR